jgi:hypothetical protein
MRGNEDKRGRVFSWLGTDIPHPRARSSNPAKKIVNQPPCIRRKNFKKFLEKIIFEN